METMNDIEEWHDLRKDPTDLPKDGRDVLCYSEYMGNGYYCFSHYCGLGWYMHTDIVAWREIPRFNNK